MSSCAKVICKRVNQLGCILPNEHTSASVAAASLAAQHGPRAMMLSDDEVDACYQGAKNRLKQLYKSEPMVFVQNLPPSPGTLVREHREFALTLFSKEDPPVSCPLNMALVEGIKARVNLRAGKKVGHRGGFDCFYLFLRGAHRHFRSMFLYIYIYV